jgi:hypothetical protein
MASACLVFGKEPLRRFGTRCPSSDRLLPSRAQPERQAIRTALLARENRRRGTGNHIKTARWLRDLRSPPRVEHQAAVPTAIPFFSNPRAADLVLLIGEIAASRNGATPIEPAGPNQKDEP